MAERFAPHAHGSSSSPDQTNLCSCLVADMSSTTSLRPTAQGSFGNTGPVEASSRLAILRPVDQRIVHCEEHGDTTACFVCRHLSESLASGVGGLGFVVPDSADAPHAWCFECESVLVSRGGDWDTVGESFAGVTVACAGCFDRMRILNSRPRP